MIRATSSTSRRTCGPKVRAGDRLRQLPPSFAPAHQHHHGESAAGAADEAATRRFLSPYRVVSLKPQIAYLAGRLERALSARDQRVGENDNWIAATALYYGESIVTNDNDFARVVRAGLPLKLLRY